MTMLGSLCLGIAVVAAVMVWNLETKGCTPWGMSREICLLPTTHPTGARHEDE